MHIYKFSKMHYSQYFLGPWRTNLKTQKSLIAKKKPNKQWLIAANVARQNYLLIVSKKAIKNRQIDDP